MKFKNVILMSLFILMFLTLSAVSASDDNMTSDALVLEDSVDDIELESGDETDLEDLNNDQSNDDLLCADSDEDAVGEPTLNSTMEVITNDATYGEPVIIEVDVKPNNATGKVSIVIDAILRESNLIDGKSSFNISGLAPGVYHVPVEYSGDENYFGCNVTANFMISGVATVIDVQPSEIIKGETEDKTIEISVNGSNGDVITITKDNLQILKDGKALDIEINDSYVTIKDKLKGGVYNLTVKYLGDDTYIGSSKNITFSVYCINASASADINSSEKCEIELEVKLGNETVAVNSGELTLALTYKNGNDNVTVPVDSFEYANATLYFPIAIVNFTTATLNVKYNNTEVNITLNRIYNARIEVITDTNEYKAGNFTFRLVDIDDGSYLVGKTLQLYTKGNIRAGFSATTDSEGIASFKTASLYYFNQNATLEMKDFEVGSYTVDLQAKENVKAELTTNLTVVKASSKLTINDIVFDYGGAGSTSMSFEGAVSLHAEVVNHPEAAVEMTVDTITVFALNAGSYALSVTVVPDRNHYAVTNTSSIIVNKADAMLEANLTVVESDVEVSAIVLPEAKGYLSIYLNGKYMQNATANASFTIHDVLPGDHALYIEYGGDDNIRPCNLTKMFTVSKSVPKINATVSDVCYGDDVVIGIDMPSSVTGNITLTIDGISYDFEVLGGKATCVIPNLKVGNYVATVNFTGDSSYSEALSSVSFYVSPKISLTPEVTIGEDGVINMELGDVDGRIYVSVDGEEDGYKRISAGKFVYHLPTWELSVGTHNITFNYSGDSFDENVFNYWDNDTGSYRPIQYEFIIHPKKSETASDSDNDRFFTLVLEDDNGVKLSNATGNVSFKIVNQFTQEVSIFVVEVIDGIAKLDISDFKNGNYLITWNYSGDAKHTPISRQAQFTIVHKPSRFAAGDISVLYTLSKTYSVVAYGSDGQVVAGATVNFLINNKLYKSAKTNSKGVASISISYAPGSYKLTVKSAGASVTKKLTVKHLLSLDNVKVKKSAKKLVIKATLKKVKGKYLKGKKITLKFNGKKYTAKTNKKGVAKFTIKSKVLKKLKAGKKVKYQAKYLKDTVKKTVKVKK